MTKEDLMTMTDDELGVYYDNYDFTDDIIEAEKNGDVIVSRPGENFFEAIARHEREKAEKAVAAAIVMPTAAAARVAAAPKRPLKRAAAAAVFAILALALFSAAHAQLTVVVNNVGYERTGTMRAIVQSSGAISETEAQLLGAGGTVVKTIPLGPQQTSAQWRNTSNDRPQFGNFKVIDFTDSTLTGEGFRVRVGTVTSSPFEIGNRVLQRRTGADVVDFFYQMRHGYHGDGPPFRNGGSTSFPTSRTAYEAIDDNVALHGSGTSAANAVRRNLRGGWWDASGDAGKHLSHLAFSNYYTPQQIPIVAWALLHAHDVQPNAFGATVRSEAAWGADYLLRSISPEGFFYMSIFDNWGMGANHSDHMPTTTQREWREVCAWGALGENIVQLADGTTNSRGVRSADYQSAFREGGGVSIAALARAAAMGVSGDSSVAQYLAGAIRAYNHLIGECGNTVCYKRYADDGVANVIDFYTALLAATELYNAAKLSSATDAQFYLDEARRWVDSLLSLQHADGYFYSGNDTKGRARPFYHAAEEGFPVVALSRFHDVAAATNAEKSRVREAVGRNLRHYHRITYAQSNPFEYAMMWRAKSPTLGGSEPDLGGGNYTITIQAENFTDREGDFRIEDGAIGHIVEGHSATYVFDALHADSYALAFRVATGNTSSNFDVIVNNTNVGEMTITNPGGWSNFRTENFSVNVQLAQGQNTIRLNFRNAVNIDWFRLVSQTIETPPAPFAAHFFIPKVNETAYWWQGENARLGSMASAFILGAHLADHTGAMWADTLFAMATAQLDWVLGRNPFDLVMMEGYAHEGRPTIPHFSPAFYLDRVRGGISNGISSARANEENVEWAPYGDWMDWRFVEQWLPHNSWFLIAVSSLSHRLDTPFDPDDDLTSIRQQTTVRSQNMRVITRGRNVRINLPFAADGRTMMALYDMRGRKIFTHDIMQGARTVSVRLPSNVARGVYVVRIVGADGAMVGGNNIVSRISVR